MYKYIMLFSLCATNLTYGASCFGLCKKDAQRAEAAAAAAAHQVEATAQVAGHAAASGLHAVAPILNVAGQDALAAALAVGHGSFTEAQSAINTLLVSPAGSVLKNTLESLATHVASDAFDHIAGGNLAAFSKKTGLGIEATDAGGYDITTPFGIPIPLPDKAQFIAQFLNAIIAHHATLSAASAAAAPASSSSPGPSSH